MSPPGCWGRVGTGWVGRWVSVGSRCAVCGWSGTGQRRGHVAGDMEKERGRGGEHPTSGALPWRCCPGAGAARPPSQSPGEGLAASAWTPADQRGRSRPQGVWGTSPSKSHFSAFSQQQSAVPEVPATFLPSMTQLAPGSAPGSSPSPVLPAPVPPAGTQPGPLLVPKAERLSPTSACGESGAPQGAPRDTTFAAGTSARVGILRQAQTLNHTIPFSGEGTAPSLPPPTGPKAETGEGKRSEMLACGFENPGLVFEGKLPAFTRGNQSGSWEPGSGSCCQSGAADRSLAALGALPAISTPRISTQEFLMSHPRCSHSRAAVKRVGFGIRHSNKRQPDAGPEHPCCCCSSLPAPAWDAGVSPARGAAAAPLPRASPFLLQAATGPSPAMLPQHPP